MSITKVAASLVDSLKAQPLTLAFVVLNILFLAVFTFIVYSINERNTVERAAYVAQISALVKQCGETK
jgi:hypothetical protein